MGPKIISRKSKKTGIAYSWRALPIGGFVAMVGENGESEDENAFCNKPVWQRLIITAAGATVNIVAGIIAMIILVASSNAFGSTIVAEFIPEDAYGEEFVYHSSEEAGLCAEDEIIKINDTKVHILDELHYEIVHAGNVPVDVTVIRDGETLTLHDVQFPQVTEQGVTFGMRDFLVHAVSKDFPTVVRHGFYRSLSAVKMIWESLADLVTGRYGVEAVSGPVGATKTLAEAASYGIEEFVNLAVILSMNLGIMNLLPLPALDGGRILFQLIELVARKPVPRNIEGYIHFGGIVVLMLFMLFITFKDVISLF